MSGSVKAACYLRVSTGEQTVAAQRDAVEDYCRRRGVDCVFYIDEGVSGTKREAQRPALREMMEAVRRREHAAVVVSALDRLARSLSEMARIGEELQQLDVELVSLRESIDTSTAAGRAMFGMCGVFAALEADLIRERTRAGLAAARRRGARIGRPEVTDQRMRERIHRLKSNGSSTRRIAGIVGISKSTVARIVADERTLGCRTRRREEL